MDFVRRHLLGLHQAFRGALDSLNTFVSYLMGDEVPTVERREAQAAAELGEVTAGRPEKSVEEEAQEALEGFGENQSKEDRRLKGFEEAGRCQEESSATKQTWGWGEDSAHRSQTERQDIETWEAAKVSRCPKPGAPLEAGTESEAVSGADQYRKSQAQECQKPDEQEVNGGKTLRTWEQEEEEEEEEVSEREAGVTGEAESEQIWHRQPEGKFSADRQKIAGSIGETEQGVGEAVTEQIQGLEATGNGREEVVVIVRGGQSAKAQGTWEPEAESENCETLGRQKTWTTSDREEAGTTSNREEAWITDREEAGTTSGREEAGPTMDREEARPTTDREDAGTTSDMEEAGTTSDREETGTTSGREEARPTTDREETRSTSDREEARTTSDREEARPTLDREEAWITDREEAGTTSDKEEAGTTSDREEAGTVSDKEEAWIIGREEARTTSDMEEAGTTSDREEVGTTSDMEEAGTTSDREEAGTTSDREEAGTTSDREEAGTTSDREEAWITGREEVGTTSDREEAGTTSDMEEAGTTSDREEAGTTSDREEAGTTSDREEAWITGREEVGTTSDREEAGTTSDREEAGTTSDREEAETVSDKEEAWIKGREEARTTSDREEAGTTSDGEEARTTSDMEEAGTTSDREEAGTTSDMEKAGTTSDREEAGTTSDREEAGTTSDREEAGTTSDMEEAWITGREEVGTTSDREEAGTTSDREEAGTTSDMEEAGTTSDREEAGTTSDREEAGTTSDREEAGTTSDREEAGTISDREEAGTTSDREEAGTTSDREEAWIIDREEVGTTSDQEEARSTSGEQEAWITGIEEAGTTSGREEARITDREEAGTTSDREEAGTTSDREEAGPPSDREEAEFLSVKETEYGAVPGDMILEGPAGAWVLEEESKGDQEEVADEKRETEISLFPRQTEGLGTEEMEDEAKNQTSRAPVEGRGSEGEEGKALEGLADQGGEEAGERQDTEIRSAQEEVVQAEQTSEEKERCWATGPELFRDKEAKETEGDADGEAIAETRPEEAITGQRSEAGAQSGQETWQVELGDPEHGAPESWEPELRGVPQQPEGAQGYKEEFWGKEDQGRGAEEHPNTSSWCVKPDNSKAEQRRDIERGESQEEKAAEEREEEAAARQALETASSGGLGWAPAEIPQEAGGEKKARETQHGAAGGETAGGEEEELHGRPRADAGTAQPLAESDARETEDEEVEAAMPRWADRTSARGWRLEETLSLQDTPASYLAARLVEDEDDLERRVTGVEERLEREAGDGWEEALSRGRASEGREDAGRDEELMEAADGEDEGGREFGLESSAEEEMAGRGEVRACEPGGEQAEAGDSGLAEGSCRVGDSTLGSEGAGAEETVTLTEAEGFQGGQLLWEEEARDWQAEDQGQGSEGQCGHRSPGREAQRSLEAEGIKATGDQRAEVKEIAPERLEAVQGQAGRWMSQILPEVEPGPRGEAEGSASEGDVSSWSEALLPGSRLDVSVPRSRVLLARSSSQRRSRPSFRRRIPASEQQEETSGPSSEEEGVSSPEQQLPQPEEPREPSPPRPKGIPVAARRSPLGRGFGLAHSGMMQELQARLGRPKPQ